MRLLLLVPFVAFGPIASANKRDLFDAKNYLSSDVIIRDVAVIGGGSSGTYSAINLQLLGQSVAVVERDDYLGGHVNTHTDSSIGSNIRLRRSSLLQHPNNPKLLQSFQRGYHPI